jgi:hypothetical protein
MSTLLADGDTELSPSAFSLNGDDGPSIETVPRRPSFLRRMRGRVARGFRLAFEAFWLTTVLAVMTALPVVQLIAFGYLLDVAGKLARGGAIGQSLQWLKPAGQFGLAMIATFAIALPIAVLGHFAHVADVVTPGSTQGKVMRRIAGVLVGVGLVHLGWAWARGGRLRHYLWPQPIEFLKRGWRPSTWALAIDRFGEWLASWRLGQKFWLGFRGALATLVWLLPGIVIIAANRNGETGLAGLVGVMALAALGVALMYLPMLQANFAAEGRFGAMFEVGRIRRDFRAAPWAWLGAMVLSLVLLPIPLYLLKIEPPPRELVWLPTWLFIAFMLPARIACGLALRRARGREPRQGWWGALSRGVARTLLFPVVVTYLAFVALSQIVSWDGLQTWVQQHAVLVPVPFVGG